MDKCLWVAAGYPVFVAAVAALWKAWRKKDAEARALNQLLLSEKERHIQELEEFRKIIVKRRG
jgi:phage-related minor tail protein